MLLSLGQIKDKVTEREFELEEIMKEHSKKIDEADNMQVLAEVLASYSSQVMRKGRAIAGLSGLATRRHTKEFG